MVGNPYFLLPRTFFKFMFYFFKCNSHICSLFQLFQFFRDLFLLYVASVGLIHSVMVPSVLNFVLFLLFVCFPEICSFFFQCLWVYFETWDEDAHPVLIAIFLYQVCRGYFRFIECFEPLM